MDTASYFDEAYFQDGSQRGTVYRNYREAARTSAIFREIARAIVEVYRPRRALEIGCATGIMVRYLNEAGCEAHGIDVSEWAVANREHPHVRLASAAELPYEDGAFDLVYSCHSIEHLPDAVVKQALREITRVSSGFHFHMLPMIGTPPYLGPADEVIANLQKDPTHVQLHPADWWRRALEETGMTPVECGVHLIEDNGGRELTFGQLHFVKQGSSADVQALVRRAFEWNRQVFSALHGRPPQTVRVGHLPGPSVPQAPAVRPAPAPAPAPAAPLLRGLLATTLKRVSHRLQPEQVAAVTALPEASGRHLSFTDAAWKDVHVERPPGSELNLRGSPMLLVVGLQGAECGMRLALGQDQGQEPFANCLEYGVTLKPGLNWFVCEPSDLRKLRGEPDASRINRLAFGGSTSRAHLRVWLLDAAGNSLLEA